MPRILKLRAAPSRRNRADIHELWGDRRLFLSELDRECIWLPSPATPEHSTVSWSDFCGCNKMPRLWCVVKKRGFSNPQSGDCRAWCQRLGWGLAAWEHGKTSWCEPRDWEKAPGERGGRKDSWTGSLLPSSAPAGTNQGPEKP